MGRNHHQSASNGTEFHPFLAVAEMAPKKGLKDLKVKVERGGYYVRLYQNDRAACSLKHRNEIQATSFDARISK